MAIGHDELDELVVAEGQDELDKLAAKGHGELNELIVAKGWDELNELTVEDHGELDELIVAKGQVRADKAKGNVDIFLPFSLTKYSAIIAEVEGYFGA